MMLGPKRIRRTGDDSPAGNLYRFVWRMSGWHQGALIALAGIVAALGVVPLELQRRIVDDAIATSDAALLATLAAIYGAALLANAGIKFALQVYQGWLSESAVRYCREHLDGLTNRRQPTEATGEAGTAVTVINAEVDAVGGFVGSALSDPARHVGILLAVMGYMLVVEPLIAVVSALFLIPQLVVTPLLQRMLNRLTERRVELLRAMSEAVADSDRGEDGRRVFLGRLDAIFVNRMRFFLWKFAGKASLNLLNNLAPLSVLAVGGWMVIEGRSEVGVVLAFVSGFTRLSDPIRELVVYYRLAALTAVKHGLIARWMSASPA